MDSVAKERVKAAGRLDLVYVSLESIASIACPLLRYLKR